MPKCDHILKIVEWGIKRDGGNVHEVASLYGCTKCDITSKKPLYDINKRNIAKVGQDHSKCDDTPCFGCKARGLQLNTGDANSQKVMSNKKWNGELDAYRAARAQGIQPAGTSMAHVKAAVEASNVMGKAFDADTASTTAQSVTKQTVKSMTEVGAI